MKKSIFTFFVLFALSFGINAQLESFMLDDFENGQVNFTELVNVNPAASMDVAVVDNPVKSAANGSNKAWEWKRYDTGENQKWAGFYSVLKNEIPSGYHRIEVKYLRKNATSQLRLKCEGAVTKEIDPISPATKTNEWETLVFDLHAQGIRNVRVFGFFPDYYDPIDLNATVYVDEIKVIYDSSITPPEVPTSLTLFDDSPDNRFYDFSWSPKATAPSTLVLENWEAGKPDGDKFPVVSTPVKQGTNALKLQWKSVNGGAWSVMAASVGWKLFDLTQMTHIKMWVNSPANLAKTALPQIFFEAGSGNPNKTGKVALENYTENLAANTWTEISIPLADLWAANAEFTAKDLIKSVFFEQKAADNIEHTLYLDDIRFIRSTAVPGEVSLMFDFGSNSAAWITPGNWNNITDPLSANVALIDNQGSSTPFVLKVTDPLYNGSNTSGAATVTGDAAIFATNATGDNLFGHGLDWGTTPANPIGEFTLSGLDASKFYSFTIFASRTGVTDIRDALYTLTGSESKSASLDASNNTSKVVAINDVKSTATGEIKLKVEAGPQNTSAQKFFFIGAMKMTERSAATSVDKIVKNPINVYYNNGMMFIGEYTGMVTIYNVTGSLIVNKQAVFGNLPVQLSKGVYIIQTSEGVGKILVN